MKSDHLRAALFDNGLLQMANQKQKREGKPLNTHSVGVPMSCITLVKNLIFLDHGFLVSGKADCSIVLRNAISISLLFIPFHYDYQAKKKLLKTLSFLIMGSCFLARRIVLLFFGMQYLSHYFLSHFTVIVNQKNKKIKKASLLRPTI